MKISFVTFVEKLNSAEALKTRKTMEVAIDKKNN